MGKIPEQAKMVFRGEIFEVWQWEQKLYDGTTAIFEKLRRPNTLNTIAVVDGNILMTRDEQPDRHAVLSLPGGRQERGETPLEGAKRELLEEAGFVSDNWEEFRVDEPSNKLDWKIYTFIARNCRKVQEPELEPGEKIEVFSLTFDQFIDAALAEDFIERELQNYIFRIKQDPDQLEGFRKRLLS